jgi:hypothetical protein
MTVSSSRQAYINAVVKNYLRLPGTPLRASRRDRRLAAALFDRRIPLRAVWYAFVVAAVRRCIRSPQQPKLDSIRTLNYFAPAIDEVLSNPLDPEYVAYLARKLRPFVAEKERLLASAENA